MGTEGIKANSKSTGTDPAHEHQLYNSSSATTTQEKVGENKKEQSRGRVGNKGADAVFGEGDRKKTRLVIW